MAALERGLALHTSEIRLELVDIPRVPFHHVGSFFQIFTHMIVQGSAISASKAHFSQMQRL